MYLSYFGLTQPPFSIAPNPHYLYHSRQHQEALAHLNYGIMQGNGFVLLTGEVGTGKTTLCRYWLAQLQPLDAIQVAWILNPRLSADELLAALCEELRLEIPPAASAKHLMDCLNHYLLEAHGQGKKVVLMIDEAQALGIEVLESIRFLTNLETSQQKLLQIILVGQPELRDLIARPDLRQLSQRITARFHLTALNMAETQAYIQHRLQLSGAQYPIFNRRALRRVYAWTLGIPRLVNVLCDRALLGAYAHHHTQVSAAIVDHAAHEVIPTSRPIQQWQRYGQILALTAVMGFLGLTVFLAIPESGMILELPFWHRPLPKVPPQQQPQQQTSISPLPNTREKEEKEIALPAPASITLDWNAFTLQAALSSLLQQWHIPFSLPVMAKPDMATVCQYWRQQQLLDCWQGTGNWQKLRQLNYPVILILRAAPTTYHYVALTQLSSQQAYIEADTYATSLAISDLDPYWLGDFWLVTTPPPRHSDTSWLQQRLPLASKTLDASANLRQQIMAFQQQHGLSPDGIAGPKTLFWLHILTTAHPFLMPETKPETKPETPLYLTP